MIKGLIQREAYYKLGYDKKDEAAKKIAIPTIKPENMSDEELEAAMERIKNNEATVADFDCQNEYELRKYQRKSESKKEAAFSPNFEILSDERLLANGYDAHEIKGEYLGESGTNSNFDLYIDKNSKFIYILAKGGKGPGIQTNYQILE